MELLTAVLAVVDPATGHLPAAWEESVAAPSWAPASVLVVGTSSAGSGTSDSLAGTAGVDTFDA